jgi:hypothetical protein
VTSQRVFGPARATPRAPWCGPSTRRPPACRGAGSAFRHYGWCAVGEVVPNAQTQVRRHEDPDVCRPGLFDVANAFSGPEAHLPFLRVIQRLVTSVRLSLLTQWPGGHVHRSRHCSGGRNVMKCFGRRLRGSGVGSDKAVRQTLPAEGNGHRGRMLDGVGLAGTILVGIVSLGWALANNWAIGGSWRGAVAAVVIVGLRRRSAFDDEPPGTHESSRSRVRRCPSTTGG